MVEMYDLSSSMQMCGAWLCRLGRVEQNDTGHGRELRWAGAVLGRPVAARAAGRLATVLIAWGNDRERPG